LAAAAAATPTVFRDVTAQSRIGFVHRSSRTSQKYLPESMSGGVAMLDYDGDGWLDLFFVNGAALRDPMRPTDVPDKSDPAFWNRLYRNNRDGTFTDVTEKAGLQGHSYGMGVAVGDYDNDGFPDLYVTNLGSNILYHNNRDGTFSDVTQTAGVALGGWSVGACFVDFDRDGRLDLMVTRYLDWDFSKNVPCGDSRPGYRAYCHPDLFAPVSHALFRNNGDGTFTDVSKAAGIAAHPGKGLGVAINDFNQNGWPDIVVANDSFPQQLFRNNGDGTFTESGFDLGMAYDADGKTFAGMGVDFADYDDDGWPDIFINALARQRYALFRNQGGKAFDYASGSTGLGAISLTHSGWGARFFDYDNDGHKDLFVAQGHVMDNIEMTQPWLRYKEPPLLLRNLQGRFTDVSSTAGEAFQRPIAARGAAFGDLNNDGFIDVVISCNDGPPLLLMNRGNSHHWLAVELSGVKSNRDGIGGRIQLVSPAGKRQFAYVSTAGSYLSASDKRVHFGLGAENSVRLLEVIWPSGLVQRFENLPADRAVLVKEGATGLVHVEKAEQ
jgi:hypothetical protein